MDKYYVLPDLTVVSKTSLVNMIMNVDDTPEVSGELLINNIPIVGVDPLSIYPKIFSDRYHVFEKQDYEWLGSDDAQKLLDKYQIDKSIKTDTKSFNASENYYLSEYGYYRKRNGESYY